jgi:hypothetical protein
MAEPPTPGAQKPARRWGRRWAAALALGVGFLEVEARIHLARPLGLIRHSADPVIVYENVPGTYVGRPTYDVWKAPMYMIWDLARTDATPLPARVPPGSTLYRIDPDGCRAPSEGPFAARADVVVSGSSQAFGMLLPSEDSVPGMLERALRADGFEGLRVANCSVVGHRFLQTLQLIRRARRAKQPRVVAVLVRPWHMTGPFPYADVMAPRNPVRNWLIQHSGLARLAHYFSWRKSPHPARLTPAQIDAGLAAYAAETRAAGVRTVFFLLDDHTPECAVFDGLVGQLRAHGLAAERIETPSRPGSMFLDPDRHWSVEGGRYTTRQLFGPVVRELEAVGPPRPARTPTPSP